ncbi:MAG: ParM/StbA family protein [Peptostreptococcaceae bacterium]
MNEVVGIDIGHITSIAVSGTNQICVESRIATANRMHDLGTNEMFEFEEKIYAVNNGDFENNLIKHEKKNFLALIYYSISKVTDADRVDVVIGIPSGQYDTRRKELKEFLEINNLRKIKTGTEYDNLDLPRQICIDKVAVVPEGYALKTDKDAMRQLLRNKNTLVVDIGGGTTDITEFNPNMNFAGGDSIRFGLLDVYRETRKVLDSKYNVVVNLEEAKKYFDGQLSLLDGNVEYKQEIALTAINTIVSELRSGYKNLTDNNIVITGGGAKIVYPTFKKLYPQAIVANDIYLNARGFYEIGVSKWQKK